MLDWYFAASTPAVNLKYENKSYTNKVDDYFVVVAAVVVCLFFQKVTEVSWNLNKNEKKPTH